MEGKRTADEAGLGPASDRPAKSFRIEDFLESMDPSVRIKLRSMFDDGLLQAEDLDERNVAELRKFDAAVALEILEHYSQADFSTVRNRRAYLAGALKRKAHLANKPQLHPDVLAKLNQLTTAGSIRGGDLDKRCMDALAGLPPAKAIVALERYGSKDFSEVRNPSALFIATIRTVMADGSGAAGGGYGPPAGSRQGGGPFGPSSSGGYGGGSAGGPTPRSYPGYPSGPPEHEHHPRAPYNYPRDGDAPWAERGAGAAYHEQPPPPPPPGRPLPQQYPATGALPGGLGMLPAAAGPASADGLPVLAGGALLQQPGGLQLPPGVQVALAPAGLGGMQPGTVIAAGGVGVQQQYVVSAGGVLTALPVGAGVIGGGALGAAAAGYTLQAPAPAASSSAAAPPPGVPAEWAASRKQYGVEQGQLGVRVAEFHGLSPFAMYVHPSPALKLQQLWDDGNELVSMFDDKVWQVLAELPAPEALVVIDDAGQALLDPRAQIRNINAYFMSVVRKVVPGHLPGPPGGHHGPSGSARGGFGGRGHESRYNGGDDHFGGGGRGGYRGGVRGGFRGRGRGYNSSGGAAGDYADGEGGYRQQQARPPGIHLLPADQRAKAEELCRDHAPLLRPEHFDEGVVASLERLPPGDALSVLEELGGNSMAGVRNLPAYIMGICKRYIRGEAGAGAVRGAGRGGGRAGGPPY